jgi:hypothetical protein
MRNHPVLYSPDEEGVDFEDKPRRSNMPPYRGKTHYFKGVDPVAEEILGKVVNFFDKEGLSYYELKGPQIREENTGQSRYIEVTVSIKLT